MFILFPCGYQVDPSVFVEKTILSPRCPLTPLSNIDLPYMYGSVSELPILFSMICSLIFMPAPHCHDYCNS